jgi:hypothetical protein
MNQTSLPSQKAKALWRWMLTALTVLIGSLLAYGAYTFFTAPTFALS